MSECFSVGFVGLRFEVGVFGRLQDRCCSRYSCWETIVFVI